MRMQGSATNVVAAIAMKDGIKHHRSNMSAKMLHHVHRRIPPMVQFDILQEPQQHQPYTSTSKQKKKKTCCLSIYRSLMLQAWPQLCPRGDTTERFGASLRNSGPLFKSIGPSSNPLTMLWLSSSSCSSCAATPCSAVVN
jgi:hypothetical protein